MPAWTSEQLTAITCPGDLIVSAAAGAGKTAVLTERLCRIVAGGTPVERLLVLTFTRAAAAEMKARIGRRLAEMAETEGDAEAARFLYVQSSAVDRANITTIDAFCSRILARHGHRIGLPALLRVADETELAVLAGDTMDLLLTRLAVERDPALPQLLLALGSEKALLETVQQAVRFLSAQPDPDGWMQRALDAAGDPDAVCALLRSVVCEARAELEPRRAALRSARAASSDPNVLRVIDGDLSKLGALLLLDQYDEYRAAVHAFSFDTLRFARGTPDAEKDPIRLPREAVKECIKRQRAHFSHTGAEERRLSRQAAAVLEALFGITKQYLAAFAAAKLEAGVIDFADMEHMALRLLREPCVADEYREKFFHIAVDEYQDSNRLQEAILDRIRRPGNLFLVGDVKQSIYRFRSAEPGLFIEKLSEYAGGAGTRVDLSANFRSSGAVLDAVNRTFSAIMTRETAGLAYDARALLRQGAPQPAGAVELHVVERRLAEGADEALEEAADAEIEARLVAEQIKRLMASSGWTDPQTGGTRPYRYQDFAVLLRANTHAVPFARQLSLLGVPCYAQSTGGYFDALEVTVLLNLLRAIDNHRQDVPLLAAAASPLGGFSMEALARMRADHRAGSFSECLRACAEGDGADADAARSFLAALDAWREESRLVPVAQLIARLIEEMGLYEEMGALPGGAERQANLNALMEKARAYEKTGARSLYGFLSYMERAEKTASVGAAQTAQADVVRILSMHKSKGLEYPVVFLCQLGRRFDKRERSKTLVLHGARGAGLRYLAPDTRARTDPMGRKALAAAVLRESFAEEMRVLYVAMTRAKHRLYLIGCATNAAAMIDRARGGPPGADEVHAAASPLHWLVMGHAAAPILHPRDSLLLYTRERTPPPLPAPDPLLADAIAARLAWTYPFASDGQLPARAAVSRLTDPGADLASLPEFRVPAFLAGGAVSAASRGTGTHLVLQHLPDHPLDEQAVRALAERLAGEGRMEIAEAHAVYHRQVAAFTHSPLFARMQNSPRVERELPFSAMVPARRVFAVESDEVVLLQGVIDCCFIEDGEWVVVDYKTDRIAPGQTPAQAAAAHAGQAALYAETLARLTGRPVKERLICLLLAGQAVPV